MRAQDFSAWLSAIAGMSVEQRREALQALTKSMARPALRKQGLRLAKAASAAGARMRWGRRASSASRLKVGPIARAARSSAGAARTGCCDFAARVAGARSTP